MSDNKNKNSKQLAQQRQKKRVARMKSFIIACAVILLFSSVILNFILIFKVLHLENQVDMLYSATQAVVCTDYSKI